MKRWVRMFSVIVILIFVIFCLKPGEKEIVLKDGFYENCYMILLKDNRMQVLVEGQNIEIDCPVENSIQKEDKIVDLQVKDNRVYKIIWKEGMVEDRVESVDLTDGWINLSRYGKKPIAGNGELYIKTGDDVRLLQKEGSLLNRETVFCYIYHDEICAVIVEGEESLQTIRVLLHGEIDGAFHEEVRVTGTKEFIITIDEKVYQYEAGEEVRFTKDMGIARVACPEGKIKMLSKRKTNGYPEYRGEIVVYSYEEGFLVRNELPLEEYLYSVVSSEMPSTYPDEALKTQAICARTYAIYQMKQAYYGEYGAHVDDTVNSQVYNNVAETDSTIRAVDETTGQYLSYENEPICAYFYSTSCGLTSDVKDVWISEGASPVYLRGRFQGETGERKDYSEEDVFYDFITSERVDCYEAEEVWFRWSSELDYIDLTKHMEEHMEDWLKGSPSYFQYVSNEYGERKENSGKKTGAANESETDGGKEFLGMIEKIEVKSRSSGGVIKVLNVIGEKGTLTVSGEYQIRKVLCPKGTKVTLRDGSGKECTMLPSGYFVVENKEKLYIMGGGYGHGVGMSQNGAMAMAKQGKCYEDILYFYYPETEIQEVY